MSDSLVQKVRGENYILEIFQLTQDAQYVNRAKAIIDFVRGTYRTIEPSHFKGNLLVFESEKKIDALDKYEPVDYYDNSILNHSYKNVVFQLNSDSDDMTKFWSNLPDDVFTSIVESENSFIGYHFTGHSQKETFKVNNTDVPIKNQYSCPSIFALQYHYLEEALRDYHNERVRKVSCEHFRNCFTSSQYIYFRNKPENCMQKSLGEFLKSRLRGVNVDREFNLGASKPVDVRVYWREANRSALIELKWLGQSLKEDGNLGTSYANARANDGMRQIKEYYDMSVQDNPTIISKGYLVVIDGRRKGTSTSLVSTIGRENGMDYANQDLTIREELRFWTTFPEISNVFRMFVEPICTT